MLYKLTLFYSPGSSSIRFFDDFAALDNFLTSLDVFLYESFTIDCL